MNTPPDLIETLQQHLAVCQELLLVAEREGQTLRRPDQPSLFDLYQQKKSLLPRLNQSLDGLRKHRVNWQRLSLDERSRQPGVGSLLRKTQDLIMKIIVLDRENEQALLRRGLVPPRELPSVNRQRPHFVADLYRRQGAA
jgi:flagellar biosynthesis/type III secretory pathway chaperone